MTLTASCPPAAPPPAAARAVPVAPARDGFGNDAETLSALLTLAGGLCADAGVRLERSRMGWYCIVDTGVIGVNLDDVHALGLEVAAGIVAHECGHALLTRPGLDPQLVAAVGDALDAACVQRGWERGRFSPQRVAQVTHRLFNCVEDGRIESFIARRYPGAIPWLDAATRQMRGVDLRGRSPLEQVTMALADLYALCPTGSTGRIALDPEPEALLRTLGTAVAAVRASTPGPSLDGWWLVQADGGPAWQPAPRTTSVEQAFQQACRLATPIVAALVSLLAQAADEAVCPADAHAAPDPAEGAGEPTPAAPSASTSVKRGQQQCAEWCQALLRVCLGATPNSRVAVLSRPPAAPSAGSPPPTTSEETRTLALAAALRQQLAPVFPPQRHRRRSPPRTAGQRPHLPALLRLEADPRASLAVWQGAPPPTERSAAVLLLVDMSGSMNGAKAQAAGQAVEACARAINGLSITLGLWGFQDELVELLPFSPHSDTQIHKACARIQLETSGTCPGGHNHPGHNDDGPCLTEAAALLRVRSEPTRLLIVFSDGSPSGRRSNPSDLRAATAKLQAPTSGIHLVGLGIGPGTEHVSTYYKDARANVALEELPTVLAATLRARLLGTGR